MKLLLTSFFIFLLLLLCKGSHAQSYPGSKTDATSAKPRPSKAAASPNTQTDPSKTSTNNASSTKPDTTKAGASNSTSTKPDTTKAILTDPSIPEPDDEFNVFLLTLTIAFFAMVIGAALIGTIAATLILLSLFALISAGVLSAGILTTLYRRSIAAGFKTILVIICTLGGIIGGTICFWLINRIYNIHLISSTAALVGAFGGLLSGLLLGFLLAGILRMFMNYCKQKLSF